MFGRKKSVTGDRVAAATEPEATVPTTDGPHDRSVVPDAAAYYAELGYGHLDLGAMVIGVPKGRELNVALDPNGQPEFHVVTSVSRVIPRAFAAPKSPGQWRNMVTSMREQLEQQGADVSIHDGPWGREIVAEMPGAVFRAIGVDGTGRRRGHACITVIVGHGRGRVIWAHDGHGRSSTTEVRVMATPENVDSAAEEGREVFKHLLIRRGDGPMPAGEQLPLTIPDEIQQALEKARAQAAAQQQSQAYQQQMAAGAQGKAPGGGGAAGRQSPQQGAQQGAQSSAAQVGDTAPANDADGAGTPPRRDGSAMDRLRGSDDL